LESLKSSLTTRGFLVNVSGSHKSWVFHKNGRRAYMTCTNCSGRLVPHSAVHDMLVCLRCGLRHIEDGVPLCWELPVDSEPDGPVRVTLIEQLGQAPLAPLTATGRVRSVVVIGLQYSRALQRLLDSGVMEIGVELTSGHTALNGAFSWA
jgi:hypothetical protein